jgi:putative hydrolase of the HAD superfamily
VVVAVLSGASGATADTPLDAVLFDAVGTLIELREPVGETYARIAARHGAAIPAWRLEDSFTRVIARAPANVHPGAIGSDVAARERAWWRARVRETFRAADQMAPLVDFDALFDALFAFYAGAAAWAPRKGARALLDRLATAGKRLGIVSNFDLRLPGVLRALDLERHFECVVLPGHCGFAKPDPRIFEVALVALRATPERCAYVGDRTNEDLEGARAAGMRPVPIAGLATLGALADTLLSRHAPPEEVS